MGICLCASSIFSKILFLMFSKIFSFAGEPNVQAKLRGHRYFDRAAVSFSLLLDTD